MTLLLTRRAVAAATLLGVCSCTGSLFQSKTPPSSVYQLSAPPPAVTAAANSGSAEAAVDLAVLRPRVRAGLRSDRIAILYPDRHLDYFADARWSGPIEEVMQDLTVQTFRSAAHLRNVTADSSAFPSGYWLELEVVDFQAEYSQATAPTIHVHLLARLGRARNRLVLGAFETDVREPAAENRLTAIVAAYEKAADRGLTDLAAQTSLAIGGDLRR